MSTIRTVNIQHPSSSTPSITMDSTGAMTGSFPYPNRNLIYNGACQIHQRSASVANLTTSDYRTADRWYNGLSSFGTWTQTVENDAPTGSGFRKSLKMLCTTADAAPAASDVNFIAQFLEGQDLQRIAKGTASAQPLTLSFWVKANVTGTYIAELQDADNNRAVSAIYTITANNVWERKVITFPADTVGVFDNDNAASLYLSFWLGAGSDRTSGTLQTTWASTVNANRVVGQVNVGSTVNNYWQITGVQLEASPVATPFEFKSFGQDLRECQRYYYLHASGADEYVGPGYNYAANTVECCVSFPVVMRTDPTLTAASGTDYYYFRRNSADDLFNSLTLGPSPSEVGAMIRNSSEISGTAGQAGFVGTNNAAASIAFSAEL